MALSTSTNFHHSSLSISTRLYSGVKPRPSVFAAKAPNLTTEFHRRVSKSLRCGARNHKPALSRITMMPIGAPRVPYKTPGEGTWQWIDVSDALYRSRIIYIGQDIDEYVSNQLLATMLYLDTIDGSSRMFFYLGSPGGDLSPWLAIYDTMQSLRSPVGTLCLSYVYNMASHILAGGEKGERFAFPLSRIIFEPPATVARGQADDIVNEVNDLLRIRDYLYEELAKHTGQPVEKVHQDLHQPKFFTSSEALDYGLIDRIILPQTTSKSGDSLGRREGLPGLG